MKKRVMVVDSDPEVCRRIQEILAITRCTVSFSLAAVAAVANARTIRPHLLIVDLTAASGLLVESSRNGSGLISIPVIVIAERGARLEAERVFQGGGNVFLPKPLDPYLLLEYVGKLLPESGALVPLLDAAPFV